MQYIWIDAFPMEKNTNSREREREKEDGKKRDEANVWIVEHQLSTPES